MLDTIDSNQTWEQLKLETISIKVDLRIITHDAVSEHPFVNISLNGFPQFGEVCDKDTVVEIDIEIDFFQLTDPDIFKYEPIDPEGVSTTGFDATKLSWNGKTTLRYTTPIY